MINKILKIFGYILIIFCLSTASCVFFLRLYYSSVNDNLNNQLVSEINTIYEPLSIVDKREDDILLEDMKIEEKDISFDNEGCIAMLSIESCDIHTIITEGVGKEQLRYSVGHFPDTPMPEKGGNFAIAGHSSVIYEQVLNNLKDIELGDKIEVITREGVYDYYVSEINVVAPTATYVLNSTENSRITIVTCTDSGKKRLVVIGETTKDKKKKKKEQPLEKIEEKVQTKSLIINTILDNIEGYKVLAPINIFSNRKVEVEGYKIKIDNKLYTIKNRRDKINCSLFNKLGRDRYKKSELLLITKIKEEKQ